MSSGGGKEFIEGLPSQSMLLVCASRFLKSVNISLEHIEREFNLKFKGQGPDFFKVFFALLLPQFPKKSTILV